MRGFRIFEDSGGLSWMRSKQLDTGSVAMIVAFRVLNALCVQTYFVPDEYWQGPEVAHRLVFGYGHLTWEWKHQLRGSVYPLIIAACYKLAQVTGTDTARVISVTPRLISAFLAAAGDCAVFELARRFFGRPAAWQALFCQLVSGSYFYCMARPLSNALETTLTIAALALWPWQAPVDLPAVLCERGQARRASLLLASLSFAVRPTSAVIFAPLVVSHLLSFRCTRGTRPEGGGQGGWAGESGVPRWDVRGGVACVCEGLVALVIGLATLVAADRITYGAWVFTPYKFVVFNTAGGASIYGTHPWHWYLSQGIPILLLTALPLVVKGSFLIEGYARILLLPILSSTLLHSFLPHKEFRFLLPLVTEILQK